MLLLASRGQHSAENVCRVKILPIQIHDVNHVCRAMLGHVSEKKMNKMCFCRTFKNIAPSRHSFNYFIINLKLLKQQT